MKALIVDDEDDIRLVARLSLSAIGGFTVVEARNGSEGVALAAAERPDVILLDVMMPTMDGPMTFAALRADSRTAAIPVIFLTAKALPKELSHLRDMGALAVLTKPFDPKSLAAEVTALLRSAQS